MGHDSSTSLSFGPGEYAPTEEAYTSVGTLCLDRGSEDSLAAGHVDMVRDRLGRPGLDQPRQMDDRVRTAQQRDEVGGRDVGRLEGRPGVRAIRSPPRHRDDLLDPRLGLERLEHARADISGGADHDNSHNPSLPHPATATPRASLRQLAGGASSWVNSLGRR